MKKCMIAATGRFTIFVCANATSSIVFQRSAGLSERLLSFPSRMLRLIIGGIPAEKINGNSKDYNKQQLSDHQAYPGEFFPKLGFNFNRGNQFRSYNVVASITRSQAFSKKKYHKIKKTLHLQSSNGRYHSSVGRAKD